MENYDMNNCTENNNRVPPSARSAAVGFLEDVLPSSGVRFAGTRSLNGMFKNFPCATVSDIVRKAEELEAEEHDAYFACATFATGASRRQDNAVFAKAFWIDVDCGVDKVATGRGYESQAAAMAAIVAFCNAHQLPAPTRWVNSGGGLHCYWHLDGEIPKEDWIPVARDLKRLMKAGIPPLFADESRTADIASVLRVPGTRNWKPERGGAMVRILHAGRSALEFDRFRQRVANAVARLPILQAPCSDAGSEDLMAGLYSAPLLEQLPQLLRHIEPDVARDEWWPILAAIADTYGEAGRGVARDWSAGALHAKTVGRYDGGDFERQYTDCLGRCYDGQPVTIGTVIKRARDGGWSPALGLSSQPVDVTTERLVAKTLAAGEPGDILAGCLFAQVCRDKLLYIAQAGRWLKWSETRWAWCQTGEEMQAAKHVADKVLRHASTLFAEDSEKNKRRMAFAMRLQTLNRLEAMVQLATSEPGMAVGQMTELDSDPWLLGVRNGVLDLKTGSLLAGDPGMLMTRQASAEYDRNARCPRWEQFLLQVFDGDVDTIRFIQRALGYTLTGCTTEEVVFICYGGGANGKSVFGNVIGHILGGYAHTAPPCLLTVRRDGDGSPRNDIAALCGARLAQINELGQGDRLDEQVVKMLAGREKLSARFLYKEHFEFYPTAKPWLRTNHRPVVTGEDDGIWRRVCLIPFRRKFAEHERDKWLEGRLLDEADGILAWMVDGCLAWQQSGLKPSRLVRLESSTYRKESDLLGEFLDDDTVVDAAGRVPQGTLYSYWTSWCQSNGTHSGSKTSFTRKLGERGFVAVKSNGVRFYAGLRIRDKKAEGH